MNRYSRPKGEGIEYSFWLAFNANGDVRLTRQQPDIKRTERSMKCTAVLPKSLFVIPELHAAITIQEPDAAMFNIDIEAAGEALRAVIGTDIDIRINRPDAESSHA